MLAQELVSILEENNRDYSRQTLLQEINYVQRLIFGSTNLYTIATDPATGLDPKLTPDAQEYTIEDAMRIDRVYSTAFELPLDVRIVDNTVFFPSELVGQEFYFRYYKKPQELTSELIELLVPDQYIDVLEDGVEERLSSKEHGSKDGWRQWKRYDLPKLRRKLNINYRMGMSDGTKKIQSYNGSVRRKGYR